MKRIFIPIISLLITFSPTILSGQNKKDKQIVINQTCKFDKQQSEHIITAIKSLKPEPKWHQDTCGYIISLMFSTLTVLLAFILGLFSDQIKKRFFDTATIKLTFDNTNTCKRIFRENNQIKAVDYRIKVENTTKKVIGRKCTLRITIENLNKDDIKDCSKALIENRGQYTEINSEYLLWDVCFNNKKNYLLDLIPNSVEMVTFIKLYKDGNNELYWEVPSENGVNPRVCLKSDKVKIKINVYGENIKENNSIEFTIEKNEVWAG